MPVLPIPSPHPSSTRHEDPAALVPPPPADDSTDLPVDSSALQDLPADLTPTSPSAPTSVTPDPKPEKAGKRKLYAMEQNLEDEIQRAHEVTRVPLPELRQMVWKWMQCQAAGKVLDLYEEDLALRKKNASS
jgi:hypothetical protein